MPYREQEPRPADRGHLDELTVDELDVRTRVREGTVAPTAFPELEIDVRDILPV